MVVQAFSLYEPTEHGRPARANRRMNGDAGFPPVRTNGAWASRPCEINRRKEAQGPQNGEGRGEVVTRVSTDAT